jgi:hypothetical protein
VRLALLLRRAFIAWLISKRGCDTLDIYVCTQSFQSVQNVQHCVLFGANTSGDSKFIITFFTFVGFVLPSKGLPALTQYLFKM